MIQQARLLLIEDSSADAELMIETLQGCKAQVATEVLSDGQAALDRVRQIAAGAPAPDLILLDLNLPGITGQEILGELRRDPTLRRIVVVVLSSSVRHSDVDECYALGANSYVAKPMGLEDFRNAVCAIERFWLRAAQLPSLAH